MTRTLLLTIILFFYLISACNSSAQSSLSSQDSTLSEEVISEDLDSLLTQVEKIHPAPFRFYPKRKWVSLKDSIIAQAPLTYSVFYAEVLRFISLAEDGHTDAYPIATSTARNAFPMKFIVFPDGLYVVAASPEFDAFLGAEILEIEGEPTQKVLEALRQIVPSDNEWGKQELLEDYVRMPSLIKAVGIDNGEAGLQFLISRKNDTTAVKIDPAKAEDALQVGPPRRSLPEGWIDARSENDHEEPFWQRNLDENFWYALLQRINALYIQINKVVEDEPGDFAKFVTNLPKPDESGLNRLIIDLRTNRGGDATILQPLMHAIIKHWDYQSPGKIFVLTSNYTFSAAVHLAAELEKNTHAIFVGEATGAPPNHYADVEIITLPNSNIEVEISRLYWQKSDPRDQRMAIYPDIETPLTWNDFIQGNDPALEAIAEIDSADSVFERNQRPLFNWFRDSQERE